MSVIASPVIAAVSVGELATSAPLLVYCSRSAGWPGAALWRHLHSGPTLLPKLTLCVHIGGMEAGALVNAKVQLEVEVSLGAISGAIHLIFKTGQGLFQARILPNG